MKTFLVEVSEEAQADIIRLIDYIENTYKAPMTAEKYLKGLYREIFGLENYAESIRISDKKSVLRFGVNARSIRYKNVSIIYTVHGNRAIVRAVTANKLIR